MGISAIKQIRQREEIPADFFILPAIQQCGMPDKRPDIIEFCLSDAYLNAPMIFPRQATLLKIIFLNYDMLNQYDFDVIGEWEESFARTGNNGISPGVLDRMKMCKDEKRPWMREVVAAIGRRGGKGHIGGICGARVAWEFVTLGNPQGAFGLHISKRLAMMVFAGKLEQARDNQWRDIYNFITNAPCFTPFIERAQSESLSIRVPNDRDRVLLMEQMGLETSLDIASIIIEPKASKSLSGRGPASFGLFFDEMAHAVQGSSADSALSIDGVYEGAKPSLDQFGMYGFMYEPSSPWQRTGKFFENFERAIEMERGIPVYYDTLMLELSSWDIYKDWERTADKSFELRPDVKDWCEAEGVVPTMTTKRIPYTISLIGPLQDYNDQMRREERANPESFAVERRGHFANVMGAYLNPESIKKMFEPWNGREFTMQEQGLLGTTYVAHGDPSKSGANFGFALGHREVDEAGMYHAVIDYVTAWIPGDFDYNNFQVDYEVVEDEIESLITRFIPSEVSFDQWNSVGTIQRLNKFVRGRGLPKHVAIYEKTATSSENWAVAETFKTALNMGLVHSPYFDLLDLEASFLIEKNRRVDHPTTGPVQTKDVWDAVSIVVKQLIGEQVAALMGEMLGASHLGGAWQGGTGAANSAAQEAMENRAVMNSRANGGANSARFQRGRPNFDGTFGKPGGTRRKPHRH